VVRTSGYYYGSSNAESGTAMAVDGSSNVYQTGYSASATRSLSTRGAYQITVAGGYDAYVVKFNNNGLTRYWSTYYGGTGNDYAAAIALDGTSAIYISGNTSSSTGIATSGAYRTAKGGVTDPSDAFVAKFNTSGALQWASYYGGNGKQTDEYGNGVAVDASHNVYLCGYSTGIATGTQYTSPNYNISTSGAFQTNSNNAEEGWLVKFNSSGVRQWGTYFGGDANDRFNGIALDDSSNVYLVGQTLSQATLSKPLPVTAGCWQTNRGGGSAYDGMIAKFSSSGSRVWATYYGGSGDDIFYGIAAEYTGSHNIYLVGYAKAGSAIASTGAFKTSRSGAQDAMFVKFNSGGRRVWGTYVGGSADNDGLNSVSVDGAGYVYVGGYSSSTNLPASGGYQTANNGNQDGFFSKFSTAGLPKFTSYYGGTDQDFITSIIADGANDFFIGGTTYSTASISHTSSLNGSSDAFMAHLGVRQSPIGFFTNDVCMPAISFTDASVAGTGETIAKWAWDFGDGTTSSLQNPVHQFATSGAHTVALTVTNNFGLSNTYSNSIDIKPKPVAYFTFVKTAGNSRTVTFTDASTVASGFIESWAWDFGDGGTSTDQNPVHTFSSNASYWITLTVVSNSGCTATFKMHPWIWNRGVEVINTIGTENGISGDVTGQNDLTGATTSIKDNNGNLQFSVYPNPVQDKLNISSVNAQDMQISISDMLGRTIDQVTVKGQTNYQVDMSALKNGVYVVRVSNGYQTFTTQVVKK
jgi:PKD repeat protein